MGFRVRRSIKIFPGLRLNLSKSGIGMSAGVKGYHVSRMANGRTRRTVSVPGTGLSWVTESSTGHAPGPKPTNVTAPRSAPVNSPKTAGQAGPVSMFTGQTPGWSAPKEEKALFAAFRSHDLDAMIGLTQNTSKVTLAACTLAAISLLSEERDDDALPLIQSVYESGTEPAADPFISRYTQIAVTVEIVDGASTSLPLDRTTIGLLLAELLQRRGDLPGAIGVVEQLEPTTITALSLAELNVDTANFDEVISITDGVANSDDATSLLWVFRGIAFREKSQYPAARECFAKVIRCTSRNPIVLHRARFERARCYVAEGKIAQARKDLVSIQVEDADYEGLTEAIAELDPPT